MSYWAAFDATEKGRLRTRTLTSTALKVYLLDKSAPGKEEGVIELCDERGKLTRTNVHFDSLGDIPDKIRELLRSGGVTWPHQPQPADPVQTLSTLEQLLEGVDENNLHHEQDTGPAVGEEVG